jgi:NADPH-dependent curcumin reductase CurA
MDSNRQIVITDLPDGPLREDHFRLTEGAIPRPGPGEVLCRNILVSLDPANRLWLEPGPAYRTEHPGMTLGDTQDADPADGGRELEPAVSRRAQPLRDIRKVLRPGDVMDAFTLSEVIDSNGTDLPEGALVACVAGWQEYAAVPAAWARPIDVQAPLTHHIGILGISGLTAYFGLLHVARPQPGETVVVSSAAGAVGTVVGQLAKLVGARVVGITSSAAKNRVLERDLSFDATVNYRSATFAQDVAAACPDGVDVFYDNVGGSVLATMLDAMNDHGRVTCCGVVSQYDGAPAVGLTNVPLVLCVKRLRVEGMTVTDFVEEWPRAEREMAAWIAAGQVKVLEEVTDGLETAPRGLLGLLAGDNIGKRTVRVAPDPRGTPAPAG